MPLRRSLTPLAIVACLALGACGDDDDDPVADVSPTVTASAPDATSATDTTATTGGDTTGSTAAGQATADRRPGCEDHLEADDGVYQVSDAGEVVVVREGDGLRLVETRPAEGWTATGDTEDDADAVEVDLRRDGREVEFDAEIDDGRLEIEVCDDE